MEQNKTGKYLKYAIGEIVLVMVGILLALQVNNWNEQRKNNNTAKYLVSSLQEDLENDIEELKSNVLDAKNIVIASKTLQLYSIDSIKYSKDIQQHISKVSNTVSFDLNNITYNEMINSGTIDLLNREIRKAVTTHYWFIESFDGNRDDLLQLKRTVNHLLIENGCAPNMINEKDLRIALKDQKLLAAIKQWEYLGNMQIGIHKLFTKMTNDLIARIKNEKLNTND